MMRESAVIRGSFNSAHSAICWTRARRREMIQVLEEHLRESQATHPTFAPLEKAWCAAMVEGSSMICGPINSASTCDVDGISPVQ